MNKKMISGLVVLAILVIGGGSYAYLNSKDKTSEKAMTAEHSADDAMKKTETMTKEDTMSKTDTMEKDKMTDTDSMQKDAMSSHGNYITLADYTTNKAMYADTKKVYFFHASWCPICQGIDKEITADMSKIPKGVTIIKTDYDSETALRQKYGVTLQYTFVQVDASENETAQWSATSLDKVIEGIN